MTSHAMMMAAQKKTRSYVEQTPNDDFIPLTTETYGCLHSCFDSFLTACTQITIVCHQQFFLVPFMFVSYYRQHASIALQHAQAIMILQRVVAFGWRPSSFSHIIVSAPSSLADLW
jgi:hypothetical protein